MSDSQLPLVSVIIPTYNRAKYVAEAIDSVLTQDYPQIELIVVDDGSTDETADIVQCYGNRLIYLCQENQGVAAARNSGIAFAHGRFLAFLDSDDIWVEGKLSWQMALLQQNHHLDAVYGHSAEFFTAKLNVADFARMSNLAQKMPSYTASAQLIRRASFDLVGLFKTGFEVEIDREWYARAQEAGLLNEMLPDVVYYRRMHQIRSIAHEP